MSTPNTALAAGFLSCAKAPTAERLQERFSALAPGRQSRALPRALALANPQDPVQVAADIKIFALEGARELVAQGAGLIASAEILVHAALQEARDLVAFRLPDLSAAIMAAAAGRRIGVLASEIETDALRRLCPDLAIVQASPRARDALESTLAGLRIGTERTVAVQALSVIGQDLVSRGAQALLPLAPEFCGRFDKLFAGNPRAIDLVEVAARAAADLVAAPAPKPFKLGIVGGLGPAATVDLFDKIVRATPAKTDQQHFKIAIEENPQCPDRTLALLHGGKDPTLTLYDCCRRLDQDGCDAIIFPCNTAHAFRERIQPHISCPILDMQAETIREIVGKLGAGTKVGLLATTGTIASRLYHRQAERLGVTLVTPDAERQDCVMDAIYGPLGAKAGYTTGHCYDALMRAAEQLVRDHDVAALILGCTELPLIFQESDAFPVAGKPVVVVDATAVMARKAVALARASYEKTGVR